MSTDRVQNLTQKIKLIRDKGIDFSKVLSAFIKLHLRCFFKFNLVLYAYLFFIIKQAQRLLCRFRFIQQTLFDNLIYVGGRQGQTSIEATLNLRKVRTLTRCHLHNRVNILLTGNNYPGTSLTFLAQFLAHRLQVEHHLRVIANILPYFIDTKDNMLIIAHLIAPCSYHACKIFDAYLIRGKHNLLAQSCSRIH